MKYHRKNMLKNLPPIPNLKDPKFSRMDGDILWMKYLEEVEWYILSLQLQLDMYDELEELADNMTNQLCTQDNYSEVQEYRKKRGEIIHRYQSKFDIDGNHKILAIEFLRQKGVMRKESKDFIIHIMNEKNYHLPELMAEFVEFIKDQENEK